MGNHHVNRFKARPDLTEQELTAANHEMDITELVPKFMAWAASEGGDKVRQQVTAIKRIRNQSIALYDKLQGDNGNRLMFSSSIAQHAMFRIINETFCTNVELSWDDPYTLVEFTFDNDEVFAFAVDGTEGSVWVSTTSSMKSCAGLRRLQKRPCAPF